MNNQIVYYCESKENNKNHNIEFIVIYDHKLERKYKNIELDLEDSKNNEDPTKLFQISPNKEMLAVRENNIGVKFISLVDGQ